MSHPEFETQKSVYLIEDGIVTLPVEKWKVKDFLRRWVAEKEKLALSASDSDAFNELRQANRALRRTPADNITRLGGIVRDVGIHIRPDPRG